jgi:hypothetical protein
MEERATAGHDKAYGPMVGQLIAYGQAEGLALAGAYALAH